MEAIYQACLAAFPADHHDYHGGASGRVAAWLWQPGRVRNFGNRLGITIVGGLIFSQMLTLYTTPVTYLYMDRLRLWSERTFQRKTGHACQRQQHKKADRHVRNPRRSAP